MHPDVVFRDVLAGLRFGLRDAQVHIRGNALGEAFRQPHFGPLPARPRRAIFEALIERGQRKIQQHHEGEFVLEEIVDHVRGRIVTANNFVEGKHGAEIEIRSAGEIRD